MAYIAFQEFDGVGGVRPAYRPAATRAPASGTDRLTTLEWSVVAIARNDGPASLRPPGRVSAMLRALFKQRNPMLADARLEALRRMAVLTWRDGYTVPSREVRAFLDAGFTPGQYETMVDHIGIARAAPPGTVTARASRSANA